MNKSLQLHDLSDANEQALAIYRRALDESREARKYLSDRGLRRPDADRFEIGYAPKGNPILNAIEYGYINRDAASSAGLIVQNENKTWRDKFADRVMFPIRDDTGVLVGFGGRVINKRPNDQRPKYLNTAETPLFKKGENLFGFNQAKSGESMHKQVLVVEGYMDVVMLSHHGINNAVAALGTSITSRQINKLNESSESVIFCFDGDDAGYRAAQRALKLTAPLVTHSNHIKFGFLPDGDDPDSYIQKVGGDVFQLAIDNQSMTFDGFLIAEAEVEHPGDDNDIATLARRYNHSSMSIRQMFDGPRAYGHDDRERNLYRIQCLSNLNTLFEFEPDYVPEVLSLWVHPHHMIKESQPVDNGQTVKSSQSSSSKQDFTKEDDHKTKKEFQWSGSLKNKDVRWFNKFPPPQIKITQQMDEVSMIGAIISAYPKSLAKALEHLGLSDLPFDVKGDPSVRCDVQSDDEAAILLVELIGRETTNSELMTRKKSAIDGLESMAI